ncbi:MAG: hypothetical protein WCT03_04910 [Candidatus Obscuribacterales bacterium]|jgi:hypothetical protein
MASKKSKSKSALTKNAEAKPEANLLGRLQTSFNKLVVTISIERELKDEVIRLRKAAQMAEVTSLKRSLPKLLTTEGLVSRTTDLFDIYNETAARLARIKEAIRRNLIPDPQDLANKAKWDLQDHSDKIEACKSLVKAASKHGQELQTKAQKMRREADKLTRRASRQKNAKFPVIKQAAEANRQAIKLERSAAINSELQKQRLTILKGLLVRLEMECLDKEVELAKRLAPAFACLSERANRIIRKSRNPLKTAEQAIAKFEHRVAEREARLTKSLEISGGIITLSPTLFMPMEKAIEINEELAQTSFEKIANLPAVETKSMSTAQVKKALSDFDLANKEMEKWCASLQLVEYQETAALAKLEEQATVWRERQMASELQQNEALAKQAKQRLIGALEAALQKIQSLEAIRAIKESAQQRLDELSLVTAKLAERLAEIEQATN